MIKFMVKRPGLVALLVLCGACLVFGPAQTGSWLGTHSRMALVGMWHFVRALIHGGLA